MSALRRCWRGDIRYCWHTLYEITLPLPLLARAGVRVITRGCHTRHDTRWLRRHYAGHTLRDASCRHACRHCRYAPLRLASYVFTATPIPAISQPYGVREILMPLASHIMPPPPATHCMTLPMHRLPPLRAITPRLIAASRTCRHLDLR